MSEPIKAGDMVIFMRSCCSDGYQYLGMIFLVERMQGNMGVHCQGCNKSLGGGIFARANLGEHDLAWLPPRWLKKIDPLAEPETEKHDEEIAA